MANRDLQMGGEGSHPDPEIRGGELKKFFSVLRASFGSKIRGGAGPLDPPLVGTNFCLFS